MLRIRLARFGRRVSLVAFGVERTTLSSRPPSLLTRLFSPTTTKPLQNLPFYRIFVAEARGKRDGRHIEACGWVDPHPGASVVRRRCCCSLLSRAPK
jgi:hypothetical protein